MKTLVEQRVLVKIHLREISDQIIVLLNSTEPEGLEHVLGVNLSGELHYVAAALDKQLPRQLATIPPTKRDSRMDLAVNIAKINAYINPMKAKANDLMRVLIDNIGAEIADRIGLHYPEVWKRGFNDSQRQPIHQMASEFAYAMVHRIEEAMKGEPGPIRGDVLNDPFDEDTRHRNIVENDE